jgi:CheY-like chemotaxis protein
MPVMNGDEATRRIRAHARETNAKTPHILALTASLQCDSSTTCDSGDDAEPSAVFDGWLTKPVTMDTIGGALLSFVQHK